MFVCNNVSLVFSTRMHYLGLNYLKSAMMPSKGARFVSSPPTDFLRKNRREWVFGLTRSMGIASCFLVDASPENYQLCLYSFQCCGFQFCLCGLSPCFSCIISSCDTIVHCFIVINVFHYSKSFVILFFSSIPGCLFSKSRKIFREILTKFW